LILRAVLQTKKACGADKEQNAVIKKAAVKIPAEGDRFDLLSEGVLTGR